MNEFNESIMKNDDFKKAMKDFILGNKDFYDEIVAAHQAIYHDNGMYVWCVELTNAKDGKKYYHPMVVNKNAAPYTMPSLAVMMASENYAMIADANQFAIDHDSNVDMAKSMMSHLNFIKVHMPNAIYDQLVKNLDVLMTQILNHIEACFEHIDAAARLTHGNAERNKIMLAASILNEMTVVAEAVTQELTVADTIDHDYDADLHPVQEDEEDSDPVDVAEEVYYRISNMDVGDREIIWKTLNEKTGRDLSVDNADDDDIAEYLCDIYGADMVLSVLNETHLASDNWDESDMDNEDLYYSSTINHFSDDDEDEDEDEDD